MSEVISESGARQKECLKEFFIDLQDKYEEDFIFYSRRCFDDELRQQDRKNRQRHRLAVK